jgi:heat shock protein HtpX
MRRNREAQEAAYETAKIVLARSASRRDAEWRAAADANRRKVWLVLCLPAIVGVFVLLCGIVVPLLLAVGAALLLAWIVIAAVTWSRASSSLLSQLGGTDPAGAVSAGHISDLGAERLADLAEGMCAALGLPMPELRVLADAVPNAIAVGRRHDDAALVVTSGLVASLDRIELEAVVAHELAHVKRLDVAAAALAATGVGRAFSALTGERGTIWLVGSDREIRADLAAVATTRYPPGLIAALERIGSPGDNRPASLPPGVAARTAGSWLVPLVGASLDGRLEVLREL